MKILIVDDDIEYAEGISMVLNMEGYISQILNNSKKAIDVIKRENPDILIMDWEMPVISGVELIKKIRSNPGYRQKYIIMVSGKDTVDDKVIGIDAGADDYLTKPFNAQELLARLRSAVRIINLQKEQVENEKKNTVLQMALSIADKVGNPLAAAQLLQQHIQININDSQKITQSVEDLGKVLIEAQEFLRKYQSLKDLKTIQAPLGKKMIDPEG